MTIGKIKSSSSRILRLQCRLLRAITNQFVRRLFRGRVLRPDILETSVGGGMLNIFSRPWGSADELIIYCIFESDKKKKNIFCVKLHQDLKRKIIFV